MLQGWAGGRGRKGKTWPPHAGFPAMHAQWLPGPRALACVRFRNRRRRRATTLALARPRTPTAAPLFHQISQVWNWLQFFLFVFLSILLSQVLIKGYAHTSKRNCWPYSFHPETVARKYNKASSDVMRAKKKRHSLIGSQSQILSFLGRNVELFSWSK